MEQIAMFIQFQHNDDEKVLSKLDRMLGGEVIHKLWEDNKNHLSDVIKNTNNGMYDGFDSGCGAVNLFFYVNDLDKAYESFVNVLEEFEILEYATIAFKDEKSDLLATLYPPFSLL